MLTKRIIACLDVKNGQVVKGVKFRNHRVVGDIVALAKAYADTGADELVFYDITASVDGRTVDKGWVAKVAGVIDIPFCVAGGIKTLEDAKVLFDFGADKVSINSPALADPSLIERLAYRFGSQAVVVGIDSWQDVQSGAYHVKQYTGSAHATRPTDWQTQDWVKQVQNLGAGEIVLNTMNQDGIKAGYDLLQLAHIRAVCNVPLVVSGGAGQMVHFKEAFALGADAALAASVFHDGLIAIGDLKAYLAQEGVHIRPIETLTWQ